MPIFSKIQSFQISPSRIFDKTIIYRLSQLQRIAYKIPHTFYRLVDLAFESLCKRGRREQTLIQQRTIRAESKLAAIKQLFPNLDNQQIKLVLRVQ